MLWVLVPMSTIHTPTALSRSWLVERECSQLVANSPAICCTKRGLWTKSKMDSSARSSSLIHRTSSAILSHLDQLQSLACLMRSYLSHQPERKMWRLLADFLAALFFVSVCFSSKHLLVMAAIKGARKEFHFLRNAGHGRIHSDLHQFFTASETVRRNGGKSHRTIPKKKKTERVLKKSKS